MPLNEYQWSADLNFTYVPMYGKFAGFGDFIFHYDALRRRRRRRDSHAADPGHRPGQPHVRLEHRSSTSTSASASASSSTAGSPHVLEVRDYIYFEKLENLTIANGPIVGPDDPNYGSSPSNPQTWYDTNIALHERRPAAGRALASSCRLPSNTGCRNENEDEDGDEAAFRQRRFLASLRRAGRSAALSAAGSAPRPKSCSSPVR